MSLPLMPVVWRLTQARYHHADLVIVSTHLFAHHVAVRPGVKKLIYVHTPARYIWEPALDSRGRNLLVRIAAGLLKPLDRRRAIESTDVAANSRFVRERVRKAWGLDARVIYPPVDVDEIRSVPDWRIMLDDDERQLVESLPDEFVLGASRFIPYKRLDQAIRAGELVDMPVVIAGAGPEEAALRARAATSSVDVHFVISPSNSMLRTLYQKSRVYVFPPVEDFGIMPVEAMAAGTPVVANYLGGASESVLPGTTGAYFHPDDDESLLSALSAALELDRALISQHATKFSRKRFESELIAWANANLGVPI